MKFSQTWDFFWFLHSCISTDYIQKQVDSANIYLFKVNNRNNRKSVSVIDFEQMFSGVARIFLHSIQMRGCNDR